jgi:hypothetical protein
MTKADTSYFHTSLDSSGDLDPERFLLEVDSQFRSPELKEEVRWRLNVLTDISAMPDLLEASTALRTRLTQIFTAGGDEMTVLSRLKELTEVPGNDGKPLDLRRFLKRTRRTYSESEYRAILGKKLENTRVQLENLLLFYPDAEGDLQQLVKALQDLQTLMLDLGRKTQDVKDQEDKLRAGPVFRKYEELKSRFLKDWLARFGNIPDAEISGLTPEEIQKLILEHQRHQMTALLRTKIRPVDTDMTPHLSLHDTLEGEFKDPEFWKMSNSHVKSGFRQWVLAAIQAFGMLKGQRYAFFQSESDKDQYLLFGLGVSSIPTIPGAPIVMVPYIKPFARKAGYLLEIRKRELGDPKEYHHELMHYVMPFLYAFDQLKEFRVSRDLIQYFNGRY